MEAREEKSSQSDHSGRSKRKLETGGLIPEVSWAWGLRAAREGDRAQGLLHGL